MVWAASPIPLHTPLCRGSAFLYLLGAYGAAFCAAVSSGIAAYVCMCVWCVHVCMCWCVCVHITLEPSKLPGLSISSNEPGAHVALEKGGQGCFPVSLGQ